MFTTLCNHLEQVDLGGLHMDMKKNCEFASQGGPIAGQILHVSNHKLALFAINPVSLHDNKFIIFMPNDARPCNFNLRHPIVGWSHQKNCCNF